jgi:exonuclease SbcD
VTKFVHVADVHIDSPLRGIENYEGLPADELRQATRKSFQNVVQLCIDEEVAFLLIAGDLFDGKWPDMNTGLWMGAQFRRLAEAGIRVFLIRGNHDAASEVQNAIRWPENVHEFSVDRAETVHDTKLAVAIHGRGYPTPAVTDDLAAAYPAAVSGCFNIGLLHTSMTGDPDHDPYAPTNLDVLLGKGYDYWALGHIHQRRTLKDEPFIGYSGNTQGRHIRETGEKGCLLVECRDGCVADITFHATDTVRWYHLEIAADTEDDVDRLMAKTASAWEKACGEAGDRLTIARVTIDGPCRAHATLTEHAAREQFSAELRNRSFQFPNLALEKIRLQTRPAVDVKRLRAGQDLLGDLLRSLDDARETPAELSSLAESLSTLHDKAPVEIADAGLNLQSVDDVRRWLTLAEGRLISMLGELDE